MAYDGTQEECWKESDLPEDMCIVWAKGHTTVVRIVGKSNREPDREPERGR